MMSFDSHGISRPVDDEAKQGSPRCCTTRRDEKQRRLQLVSFLMNGLLLPGDKLVESLELLIAPGDRIALEGDNQKQTDS
jgi:malonate decarboxylase alpha subunit